MTLGNNGVWVMFLKPDSELSKNPQNPGCNVKSVNFSQAMAAAQRLHKSLNKGGLRDCKSNPGGNPKELNNKEGGENDE